MQRCLSGYDNTADSTQLLPIQISANNMDFKITSSWQLDEKFREHKSAVYTMTSWRWTIRRFCSDELETLLLIVRYTSLEQNGVHSELRVEQRHVAVDLHEKVHALVSLVEVRVLDRQCLRATRTSESPPRRHLCHQ